MRRHLTGFQRAQLRTLDMQVGKTISAEQFEWLNEERKAILAGTSGIWPTTMDSSRWDQRRRAKSSTNSLAWRASFKEFCEKHTGTFGPEDLTRAGFVNPNNTLYWHLGRGAIEMIRPGVYIKASEQLEEAA